MAKITITIGSLLVTCGSPEEAAEFVRVFRNGGGGRSRSPEMVEGGEKAFRLRQSMSNGGFQKLLAILETVRGAGSGGIASEGLAAKHGLRDGRSLGVYVGLANRLLEGTGLSFHDSVTIARDRTGTRGWYPGAKLPEVIARLSGNEE